MSIYLALLHYPVYNKRHEVVSTCITGFDLHDIARTAATFGVKKYYVVNPMPAQREFAARIVDFWGDEESMEFNWTRAEAFKLISIKENLEEAVAEIEKIEGQKPVLVGTSAKPNGTEKFENLRLEIENSGRPYLIMLGTGWGMTDELLARADIVLEPIKGTDDYNHLPVRSANAIILDRLLS
ncbi:MAG: RNA methyltransferase [Candidatus Margulisbacteria bacterium]|nr:RNA methyltransferase [Candidatus Margulisiibacteriota bacterium]